MSRTRLSDSSMPEGSRPRSPADILDIPLASRVYYSAQQDSKTYM
jgi:hypothetical protein